MKFPTGGKAREPIWHDSVKFRSRQYSLDERRYQVQNPYGPALVEAALGCVCILELSFLHKDPLCLFALP